MGLFGGGNSSANQTTTTVSGQGQIVSGSQAQITNPGSIAVGSGARYQESGSIDLANSGQATLGSRYDLQGAGSTLNIQNLDPQVVTDALSTVASLQQQGASEAAANQAALQAATQNLNSLLGQGSTGSSPLSGSMTTYLYWGAGGLLVALLLFWLFRKKK